MKYVEIDYFKQMPPPLAAKMSITSAPKSPRWEKSARRRRRRLRLPSASLEKPTEALSRPHDVPSS